MSEKLTGRRRHRTQRYWGTTLLVLQVEVSTYANQDHWMGGSGVPVLVWRDATPEDLTVETT